jgi:hypothetical protein
MPISCRIDQDWGIPGYQYWDYTHESDGDGPAPIGEDIPFTRTGGNNKQGGIIMTGYPGNLNNSGKAVPK